MYNQIKENSCFNLGSSRAPQNHKTLSLKEIKKDLQNLILNLKQLNENEKTLRTKINNLNNDEWNFKLNQLNILKKSIEFHLEKYNNSKLINQIKKLIRNRKKKRLRLKCKRKKQILQKNIIIENRKNLDKKIDELIKKENQNNAKEKQSKEAAEHAGIVLSGVNEKINDAKQYLQLLNSLKELRKVRKIAAQKNDDGEKDFENNINKLINVWKDALNEYEDEEAKLRTILQNSYKTIEKQWNDVIFGPENNQPPKECNQSFEEFLEIRRTWDSYLVPNDSKLGSRIPNGWILPNKNPTEQWSQYSSFKV